SFTGWNLEDIKEDSKVIN
uniref:Uncharacterized protein n=1 Tax=Strongyloides papillosus TaxID=174720 RepID=A0A0N5C7U6_STREA